MVQSNVKKKQLFTDYELRYIAQHRETQNFIEMGIVLGRSANSVRSRWEKLRREPHLLEYLRRTPVERITAFEYYKWDGRYKIHYTRDERALVIQNYSWQYGEELARKLGRSESSVRISYYNWKRNHPEAFEEMLFVDVEELAVYLGIEEAEEDEPI